MECAGMILEEMDSFVLPLLLEPNEFVPSVYSGLCPIMGSR